MADTVYQAFAETCQRFPSRPALMHKLQGRYRIITFQELSQMIDEVAAGLAEDGVRPGSMVGIYSYNRPEWVIADMATIKLGAVVVPVYHTLPEESVGYILRDAGVTHLFVETPELFATVTRLLPTLPNLKEVITFFKPPPKTGSGPKLLSIEMLRRAGTEALSSNPDLGRPHP
ncbi:MAG: AMP-binding protein, partial [candidate division WOR-3 bacterium]